MSGSDPPALSDLSRAELYNLAEDIGETRNLAVEHPEKVKKWLMTGSDGTRNLLNRAGHPADGPGSM